jgi:DNA polymerase-1
LCWFLFGRKARPIEALIGKGKDQITMDKVPIEKVAERACLDAQDALEAWDALKDKVPWKAIELETRFLPVAMNMERRGIHVDTQKVSNHRQRLEKEMAFLRNICEKQGFNPGSSIQLGEILEHRGYKVLYKTGKDGKRRPRLNKEILSTYYIAEPAAAMTLKYRSTQTLLTHLIKPIDDGRYINNGIIYPRVNLNVAATGRISRSVPATQNISEGLRDIIIPTPGNIIYDWDFSQIELRCAAYMWEDKVMEEIFQRGEDVHTGTANELVAAGLGNVLGNTPAKRRRLAKDLNFAMLFGGDEETLWNRKQIPKDIGKKLVQGYFERFKGIARGIEATKEFALKNGYTRTLYGRRRDESDRLQSGSRPKIAAALRELVNHPIQGTAAEILKEAMWMDQKEPQFHTVHDEVLLDVPVDYEYLGYLHKAAPFKTEIKAKKGFNWKDMVEV